VEKFWLPMKGMISLILLLVGHVFRGYKFLVVFRQVWVWHRKIAEGWLGWSAGQVWLRNVQGGSA